jgi:hypothetical protein
MEHLTINIDLGMKRDNFDSIQSMKKLAYF